MDFLRKLSTLTPTCSKQHQGCLALNLLFMLKDMNILHKWFYMPTSVPMFYLAKKRHMILFGGHLYDPALSSAFRFFFPQQRKLMVSSAQNSSRVHWCRRWVRFNEVPEKVPKVPEKVWEALMQRQVTFNRVPEKVPEKVWEALVQRSGSTGFWRRFRRRSGRLRCRARSGSTGFWRRLRIPEKWARSGSTGFRVRFNRVSKVPEKVWEALVQSEVRFNRVPEKVPVGAEPGQVQQGSREGSGEGSQEGLGGFGAKPGQVQQGSQEGSGEGSGRLWCKARSGSTGFRRRLRRRSGRLWCRARSGSTGFWRRFRSSSTGCGEGSGVPEEVWEALVQSQVMFNRICGHLIPGNPAEVFPALGFAARFKKICKNKTLRLLGIPPKLIPHNFVWGSCFWFCIPGLLRLLPPPPPASRLHLHTCHIP